MPCRVPSCDCAPWRPNGASKLAVVKGKKKEQNRENFGYLKSRLRSLLQTTREGSSAGDSRSIFRISRHLHNLNQINLPFVKCRLAMRAAAPGSSCFLRFTVCGCGCGLCCHSTLNAFAAIFARVRVRVSTGGSSCCCESLTME